MPRNPELLHELNLQCTAAIDKFDKFKDGVIPIAFVEDWLKANEELKIKTSLRPEGPPGVITFFETEEDYKVTYADIKRFYRLYESLVEFNEYRKFEPIAKTALKEFKELSQDENDLKQWIEKYKQLGEKDLICFGLDYLDYDAEKIVYYPQAVGLDINIEKECVASIIEFTDKFNELYFIPDATE